MDAKTVHVSRVKDLFESQLRTAYRRADRMFAGLMVAQWIVSILFAIFVSPRTWAGTVSQTHIHVYAAIFLGGIITSLPVILALNRSGQAVTRHSIAIGQMLMSALLIHLTGGRIETHFHVFGSLAFLAFYRDWPVLLTATTVVILDHGVRGFFLPQSVYGALMVQPWRFVEHAGWVMFENIFLIHAIHQSRSDMRMVAERQVQLEELNDTIEQKVIERTRQLADSNEKLDLSRKALLQSEKLSAVGQLAGGVAHEINNPLGIILGFAQSIKAEVKPDNPLMGPLSFIEKEAVRCKELVQNLLVFSRSSQLEQHSNIDVTAAVKEALSLITAQSRVKDVELKTDLASGVPPVSANKNQVQQIVINLCNNAMDAMTDKGVLVVRTGRLMRNGAEWATIEVEDTGGGIPKEIQSKIFEPFFTTKDVGKGTGLGLSLVYEIVQKHHGFIEVESDMGKGTKFIVCLPINANEERNAA